MRDGMRKKKSVGQVQMENIFVFGLGLTISLLILYIMLNQVAHTQKVTKAEDAVHALASKADEIMVLGRGSKDVVVVDIPGTVEKIIIERKKITLTLTQKNGEPYNITARTKPYLTGTIENQEGVQKIYLQKINDTLVLVGKAPVLFNLDPACIGEPLLGEGVTITITGAGFQKGAKLLKANTPYTSSLIDGETMTFEATVGNFVVGTYAMAVENPDLLKTNELLFEVREEENLCVSIGGE